MPKVVVIGKKEYIPTLYSAGFEVTLDPLEDHPIICDAATIKNAPFSGELIVILSGSVTDWAAKQSRPDAVFVKSLEEAISVLPKEPIIEAEEKPPVNQLLILTHSNKGGVGKTTTAIALAEMLSQRVKTVLCDFDFTAPDIASFYNLKPENYFEGSVKPIQVTNNLFVLPAPKNIIPATFQEDQLYNVVQQLAGFQVIIGDTPPAPWDKPHFHPLFAHSDIVYSIVDQSLFSLEETKTFAPTLIGMGVSPENINIVVNRYTPRQNSVKAIENAYCANFKRGSALPKVVALVPHDWEKQMTASYQGKVLNKDIWEDVCKEIFQRLGLEYIPSAPPVNRFKNLFSFKK